VQQAAVWLACRHRGPAQCSRLPWPGRAACLPEGFWVLHIEIGKYAHMLDVPRRRPRACSGTQRLAGSGSSDDRSAIRKGQLTWGTSAFMSGQSWSRREAPWGARAIYSNAHTSGAALSGPGMQIQKKRRRVRVSADMIVTERAALEGKSAGEYLAARDALGWRAGPSSTKERARRDEQRLVGAGAANDPVLAAAAAAAEADDGDDGGWFYVDPGDEQQGPFGAGQLKAWYKQGYLKDETRVKPWRAVEFKPLSLYRQALKIELPTEEEAKIAGGITQARRSSSSSSSTKGDSWDVGPGGREPGAWQLLREGAPPYVRSVWWNVVTDERVPAVPRRPPPPSAPGSQPPAPAPPKASAPNALAGLGGYSTDDSD
jgi:hypothetical protein